MSDWNKLNQSNWPSAVLKFVESSVSVGVLYAKGENDLFRLQFASAALKDCECPSLRERSVEM